MVRSSVTKRCGVMLVAQLFNGEDGRVTMFEGHEIFSLQFAAARWSEVHLEVRQALVPRAGDALLISAAFCGVAGDGVQFFLGECGAEELRRPMIRVSGGEAALDPDLGGAVILPVREEAHAVACAEDFFKVVLERIEGEVLIDRLRDLIGGLQVKRDPGEDAERTEMHNGAEEADRRHWRGRDAGSGRRR